MGWLLWAVLSAFFAGVTAILAKIGVEGVDANLATAVRTTVVLGLTWLLFWALAPARSLAALSMRNWVFLVLSGIATGLSWVCYFRALQLGPASKVAPIDKLSVVFVIAFAALFLHKGPAGPRGLAASSSWRARLFLRFAYSHEASLKRRE